MIWWKDRVVHLINFILFATIILIINYFFFERPARADIKADLDKKASIIYVNNAILARYDSMMAKQDVIIKLLKKK